MTGEHNAAILALLLSGKHENDVDVFFCSDMKTAWRRRPQKCCQTGIEPETENNLMKKLLVSTAGAVAGLAVTLSALSAIDAVSDASAKARAHVSKMIGWAQEYPWPSTYNVAPTPDHCMTDDGYGRRRSCAAEGGSGS